MAKSKLTQELLKKLHNDGEVGKKIFDSQITGFYVKKLSNKLSFNMKYYSPITGKNTSYKFGDFPAINVSEARKIATSLAATIAHGNDPKIIKEEKIRQKLAQSVNTPRKFLERYFEEKLSKQPNGKNTVDIIHKHFAELLDKPMPEINHQDMTRWLSRQEAITPKPQPTSIKKRLAYFKAMLNYAAKMSKVIDSNPISDFNPTLEARDMDRQREINKQRNALTKEQVDRFLKGLDLYQKEKIIQRKNSIQHGKGYLPDLEHLTYVDYVKPVMLLLFYTGLRPGDILNLHWSEVDLKNGQIVKVISKTRSKKTHPATIEISDNVEQILKTWLKENCNSNAKGYVFANPETGKPYLKLNKPWNRIKELGGLDENLQNYSLRHHFISQLIMEGESISVVAKLVGTSPTMIEKHYGHVAPSKQKSAVNRFAKLYST